MIGAPTGTKEGDIVRRSSANFSCGNGKFCEPGPASGANFSEVKPELLRTLRHNFCEAAHRLLRSLPRAQMYLFWLK